MSRGYPSLTALLGLLAIAGYQNRDKLAELLRGADKKPGAATQGGIGGFLDQLRSSLGGATPGGILSGGLGELVDRFKQSGQGDKAESWVGTGPNKPVTLLSLSRLLDLTLWSRCRSKRAYRETNCCPIVSRTSRRCR